MGRGHRAPGGSPGPGAARRRPLSDADLDRAWFARRIDALARGLLGARLESELDGEWVAGTIVETEAYFGPEDPASHAATLSGPTPRNRLMFGPAGYAYVYRIYGMHWCLNVVGGRTAEEVGAVLIRGVEVDEGIEVAQSRRGRNDGLADGPGKLCQAFGVDGSLHGHDLTETPLRILPGAAIPDAKVRRTGRVGIRSAATWPLRYLVADRPGVSRARAHPGDPADLPDSIRAQLR